MAQMSEENQKKCKHYRLNATEFEKIKELLGREPQGIEWALFSALWSEHCSYKSSKIHLRKLFNQSPRVLEAEGENAGVIDLGEGERVAFKMESHNHPSFIEPYQGAATGVGGILRDIFTMGARPIALADYLCFGDSKADRMSTLVNGVVRGIGGYGNCVGVPTITGRTEFHSRYNKNILVNAMAVGLFRKNDKIALSKAKGAGNWVVYVGAKTGKDGVHGASMASESFDENSDAKKPNVQIGDPYFEKLLIESCLEVMKQDLVVAIQDMGAAGLTSSSFEMASKGGVGMKMDLGQVPLRDSSMSPEEILLSESQERMLLVCEPAKFPKLKKVFENWGLDATHVGEITTDRKVELIWRGETICKIDPDLLVENAPRYERPYHEWKYPRKQKELKLKRPAQSLKENLKSFFSHPQGGDRSWIYEQYDGRVGGNTAMQSSNSIGLVRLPDSGRGMAVVVGCRPHVMRIDAKIGAQDAILYPSLQMAAKGCEALAVTDCLNFGNPEKPEIMSEFVASIEGMSEMAKALDAPIVSGNVSFYNETLGENITSTPATGLVGLRPDVNEIPSDYFEEIGDSVYLLRLTQAQLSGFVHENSDGTPHFTGGLDASKSASFCKLVQRLADFAGIRSTRVVGSGGIATTLAKMTFGGVGFSSEGGEKTPIWEEDLLQENLYEVVFVMDPDDERAILARFEKLKTQMNLTQLELWKLGQTCSDVLQLKSCEIKLSELEAWSKNAWRTHFENLA